MLISREKEIDDLIERTKQQGYTTFVQLFSSGFTYASNLFMNSALRGHSLLGTQLRRSLSMTDVNANANANTNSTAATKKKVINTITEDDFDDHEDHVDSNYTNGRLLITASYDYFHATMTNFTN